MGDDDDDDVPGMVSFLLSSNKKRTMDINSWGSAGWNFMHACTFAYPTKPLEKDKKDAIQFFRSVGNVLPCHACRTHYYNHMKSFPVESHVDSRDSLSRWLVHVHNLVNASRGVGQTPYDVVYKRYMQNVVVPDSQSKYTLNRRLKVTKVANWSLGFTVFVLSLIIVLLACRRRK